MSYGILKFKLPEEQEEHAMALKGAQYRSGLSELDDYLRDIIKYDERVTEDVKSALQLVRDELCRITSWADQ